MRNEGLQEFAISKKTQAKEKKTKTIASPKQESKKIQLTKNTPKIDTLTGQQRTLARTQKR